MRRFFERIEQKGLTVNRFRADCGSCSEEIVEEVGKHCKTFYICANRCGSLYDDIFALRGWKKEELGGIEFELNSILVEKWKGKAYRLVIQRQKRNFYKFIMARLDVKGFGLKATSRIKAFVFKFISVPAKWGRTSRQYVLNMLKTDDIHPPKTGISVHFSCTVFHGFIIGGGNWYFRLIIVSILIIDALQNHGLL